MTKLFVETEESFGLPKQPEIIVSVLVYLRHPFFIVFVLYGIKF